jgi:predicted aminopeptidase
MRKTLIICSVVLLLGLSCLLFGCGNLGYYLQSASGQLEILSKRRPITELLDDAKTDAELKKRLRLALEIREFAATELALPDNGSYRSYADLKRPYVVWNVVATPEFSLQPETWCFPIAGCLPYRGYYHEAAARGFAAGLEQTGLDTATYGVAAYSTLKWFSDPILNTFSSYSEEYLAGLIFHELAHQQVYIAGQADFNEAYAKTVERVGVARWFEHKGDPEQAVRAARRQTINREFVDLAMATRQKLQQLYRSGREVAVMRAEKGRIIKGFQKRLREFRQQHNLTRGYDNWLAPQLNNALFASVSTYHELGPAFEQLLVLKNNNLPAFHREVARIARLDANERKRVLEHLSNLYLAAHQTSGSSL